MTISIIKPPMLFSTDIENIHLDYADMHNYNTFSQRLTLVCDEVVYERTGLSIYTSPPSSGDEVGDYLYDVGELSIVECYANSGDILKQPSEYVAAGDLNWNTTYTEIYSQVSSYTGEDFTGANMFSTYYNYNLYKNPLSPTGWTLHVVSESNNIDNYSSPKVIYGIKNADDNIMGYQIGSDGMSYIPEVFICDPLVKQVYMRTPIPKQVETVSISAPVYLPIRDLRYFSGWTKTRMSRKYTPIDGKHYTDIVIKEPTTITFTSTKAIDTVALSRILADSVTVNFYIASTVVFSIVDNDIDNTIDEDGRASPVATSKILYSDVDIPAGNKVEIIITPLVEGSIGDIDLGLSVDAGFTLQTFANKFKDYGVFERDQWGNVLYVPGVKSNIYAGSVDVEITNYDTIRRLMSSIGGETVIMNGSDSMDNSPVDSENFFSSTMVVGRISDFALQTRLNRDALAQMANYGFTMTENV